VRNILSVKDQLKDLILRLLDAKGASEASSAAARLWRALNAQRFAERSTNRYIDGTRTPSYRQVLLDVRLSLHRSPLGYGREYGIGCGCFGEIS